MGEMKELQTKHLPTFTDCLLNQQPNLRKGNTIVTEYMHKCDAIMRTIVALPFYGFTLDSDPSLNMKCSHTL